jgi:hypothetical protein
MATDADRGRETLTQVLAEQLARLGAGEALALVELGADGIVSWEVHRDSSGTPRAWHWPAVPVSSLGRAGVRPEQLPHTVARAGAESHLTLVVSSPDEPGSGPFGLLSSAHPDAPVLRGAGPLGTVLRDVIADDPLTCWYELVGLRPTKSGRLLFGTQPLIPPGARRGYRRKFVVRCERSDDHGTVFAVVSAEQGRRLHLLSVESATLAPGVYRLTAELRRPGLVGWLGLPAKPGLDHRRWSELVAAVPERLDRAGPAHLICAIEVSGSQGQVEDRISRVEQLIRGVDDVDGGLNISLISYGPHSFERGGPDSSPAVLTWATTSQHALSALSALRDRGPMRVGYPRAAQLECVLAEVADRLTGPEGRVALVSVGARPAFPPRVDPRTEILPCPRRRDWRLALGRLRQQPGIAFGAIRDPGPNEAIWTELGREAFAPVDAVDIIGFATSLGLQSGTVPRVPFPLIETEGG